MSTEKIVSESMEQEQRQSARETAERASAAVGRERERIFFEVGEVMEEALQKGFNYDSGSWYWVLEITKAGHFARYTEPDMIFKYAVPASVYMDMATIAADMAIEICCKTGYAFTAGEVLTTLFEYGLKYDEARGTGQFAVMVSKDGELLVSGEELVTEYKQDIPFNVWQAFATAAETLSGMANRWLADHYEEAAIE